MKVTIEQVKRLAWEQTDGEWHNQSGITSRGLVTFKYKGHLIMNPWMDETMKYSVNPYKYYGAKNTNKFIKKAIKKIKNQ